MLLNLTRRLGSHGRLGVVVARGCASGDRRQRANTATTRRPSPRGVRPRHECQCAIGEEEASVLPLVLVIKSSAAAAIEQKAGSQAINNSGYNVTSGCNLSLVLI